MQAVRRPQTSELVATGFCVKTAFRCERKQVIELYPTAVSFQLKNRHIQGFNTLSCILRPLQISMREEHARIVPHNFVLPLTFRKDGDGFFTGYHFLSPPIL